jgi:hypothetical protein
MFSVADGSVAAVSAGLPVVGAELNIKLLISAIAFFPVN